MNTTKPSQVLLGMIPARLNGADAIMRPHPKHEGLVLVETPRERVSFTRAAVLAASKNGWQFVSKERMA